MEPGHLNVSRLLMSATWRSVRRRPRCSPRRHFPGQGGWCHLSYFLLKQLVNDQSSRPTLKPSRVAGVFAAARTAAPAVIFLDEADAAAPARPHSAAGGGRFGGPAADAAVRLVATLLSEMDGGAAGDHLMVTKYA